MSNRKQRLELTWVGKDERPRLEPRILIEDHEYSYHATKKHSADDIFENKLVFGDNLLALKALQADLSGRIKCIYIDPPFNTQQAFDHYEDGREHSSWLTLVRDRIDILHKLLSQDGTIFVHIDDNELGYLICLMDEVFGRTNRLYVITFKQGAPTGHKAINPGCVTTTNFVLVYAKDRSAWSPNRVFTERERDKRYNQYITNADAPFESWRFMPLVSAFADINSMPLREARKKIKQSPELLDEFVIDNAERVIRFARPDYNAVSAEAREYIDKSRDNPDAVYRLERTSHPDMYLRSGERILFYKDKLREIDGTFVAGEPVTTLWDDLLSNNLHNEGGVSFPKGKKPEALIKRCLELVTASGDLVLDSFAGSGTTGAVAHKMGRRWIMVELGEHCHTHIVPRMRRVIDGTDASGVTSSVGWKGGGGFQYFRLAPSLLEKDGWGNWVISDDYNAAMLSEAVCKLMGFTYAPSDTHYWMHGHSTETDFIYVTTQSLTHDQLRAIADEVGEKRTLLICCKAFRANTDAFENLTVKKIPHAVLRKCEWGRDDYSLNVANLPMAESDVPDESQGDDAPQEDLFNQRAG